MRTIIVITFVLAACAAPAARPPAIPIGNAAPSFEPLAFAVEGDAWQLDMAGARLEPYDDDGVTLRSPQGARSRWRIDVRPAKMAEMTAAEELELQRTGTIALEPVIEREDRTFDWTLVYSRRGAVFVYRSFPGRDGDAIICETAYRVGFDWRPALDACNHLRPR